jgi:Uma2 family endonuclease
MRNANLTYQLAAWAQKDHSGINFDSSTGFSLPNRAMLSPDASWIKRERWDSLTEDEQEGFAPLCPDFVVEIRSRSDDLPPLESKMKEYIANGALLAWLIDPLRHRVYVYAPGQEVIVLESPDTVSGGCLLPGFEFGNGSFVVRSRVLIEVFPDAPLWNSTQASFRDVSCDFVDRSSSNPA